MQSIQKFFQRQSFLPFETGFGFFCMYSGIAGLLSWGIPNDLFRKTLGFYWSTSFNIAYILAGAGIYFGLGLNRKDIEAIGLITVVTSMLIRSVVIFYGIEFDQIIFNSYIYTAAFTVACISRLYKLLSGHVLVVAKGDAQSNG